MKTQNTKQNPNKVSDIFALIVTAMTLAVIIGGSITIFQNL